MNRDTENLLHTTLQSPIFVKFWMRKENDEEAFCNIIENGEVCGKPYGQTKPDGNGGFTFPYGNMYTHLRGIHRFTKGIGCLGKPSVKKV